jgi:hypothetical protein
LAGNAFRVLLEGSDLDISRQPLVDNPFSRLPPEPRLQIFAMLTGRDLFALPTVSRPAFLATRRPGFWKWLIGQHMPWLTGVLPLCAEPEHRYTYKAVYVFLSEATVPRFGMNGPLLPLANGRRIWDVCEQLAAHYHCRLR